MAKKKTEKVVQKTLKQLAQPKRSLKHIIGRTLVTGVQFINNALNLTQKTVDETPVDYEWWDMLRHGRQKGYELSGPQTASLNEIVASWVMGRGVTMELAENKKLTDSRKLKYTNDMLRQLFSCLQSELTTMYEDLLGLGDQYAYVNPDNTVTWLRPDTVRVWPDKEDANKVDHFTVVSVTDTYVMEEEFYKDKRVRRMKLYKKNAGAKMFSPPPPIMRIDRTGRTGNLYIDSPTLIEVRAQTFSNPTGVFPIVHFSFNKGRNELYGHPLFESLREKVLSEFDDIANKSFKGARLMGTPIPVISGLVNPDDFKTSNETQEPDEYIDKDGNEETRDMVKWDENTMLILGEGGDFGLKSPAVGFSADIRNILNDLRRMMRDRTHVPPYMWGGEETKKEAVEVQNESWVRIVEGLRDKVAGKTYDEDLGILPDGGLHELAYVWLKMKGLSDAKILVAPTVVRWQDLSKEDRASVFEYIKWLHSRGIVTDRTALEKADIVENVELELETAKEEFETRPQIPGTDFGGVGNDVKNPLTAGGKPDQRPGVGADSPRMPAYGGGGENGNN